jgi:hypothetical protein
VTSHLSSVIKTDDLWNKFLGIYGDKSSTDFEGISREGKKNVYMQRAARDSVHTPQPETHAATTLQNL